MSELYGIIVTAALLVLGGFVASDGCDAREIHAKQCESACTGRGEVFERKHGVCTCRDGTVWLWREGYSRKLGAKP